MTNNLSVFGLGKLGASMVAAIASRGFNIIGVDILERSVSALNNGLPPVQETGLAELIDKNKHRIKATLDTTEAVLASDVSFVIVPTPSNSHGAFEIQYVGHAFKEIGKALKTKDSYHLIVLTSTVLPGSLRYGLIPILEKESGKKCGGGFGVCYSPALIAIGTIIRDFLNPDFNFIGEFDKKSGDILEDVYARITLKPPVMRRMSIENAEIAKIALNSYVTMKISFANIISHLCEQVPTGDVDVVTQAIGSDSRIGPKFLRGGLGFGGTCFPRDNIALSFICNELSSNHDLLDTTDSYNNTLSQRFVDRVLPYITKGETAAVLGLAYKPLSHIVEESQAILLAKALSDTGLRVIGYDPLANDEARPILQYHTLVVDSLSDALKEATIVFVANNDDVFKSLTPDQVLLNKKRATVVDFWRCLSPKFHNHPRIKYVPIGKCLDPYLNAEKFSNLWGNALQKSTKPVDKIPQQMIDQYSMGGEIPIKYSYRDDSSFSAQDEMNKNYTKEVCEDYLKRISMGQHNYYGATDLYLYNALNNYPIKDQDVCVIGSANPWYEIMCLYFGARSVTVIEYSERKSFHEKITYKQPHEGLDIKFDSCFSISSFEHDGLGRYGDPLNPNGDLEAMQKMKDILKPEGLMFLAVPVGKDAVWFNVHRVYGERRFHKLTEGWKVLGKYGFDHLSFESDINNGNSTMYQPLVVLENTKK